MKYWHSNLNVQPTMHQYYQHPCKRTKLAATKLSLHGRCTKMKQYNPPTLCVLLNAITK
jgi:hypothetical protein